MQIAASKFGCKNSMQQAVVRLSVAASLLALLSLAHAEEPSVSKPLYTQISKVTIQLPAGSLSETLPAYAAEMGVNLVFDAKLTQGKTSKPLKGQFNVQEGFNELLKDTLLEVVPDNKGGYLLKYAPPKQNVTTPKPIDIALDKVQVRAKRFYEVGALPGLGLTKEEIPGNVQSITAKEIKESRSLSLTDLMNKKLQSVTVNDYQGNPFQMDVQYRGFTASPQIGTSQGLSVFFDGIRVNEPFGDVVNWDMIPMNALSGFDVFPGSNPLFGLGTLGGALTMKTKDGFSHEGTEAEVLTGSFGRKQLQISSGWNNGTVGLFGAGNFFLEDGWRDNSPTKVNQMFGKASYRGDKLDLSLSTLIATNDLVGNGLIPSQMYEQRHDSVFTSPDSTKNRLTQFQLAGSFFVNDNFTITGQVYRRNSDRKGKNGDVFTDFGPNDIASRRLNPGENAVCGFQDVNSDGIPDYFDDVLEPDPANPGNYLNSAFLDDFFNNGTPNFALLAADAFNKALPPETKQRFLQQIALDNNPDFQFTTSRNNNFSSVEWPNIFDADGNPLQLAEFFEIENPSNLLFNAFPQTFYTDTAGRKHNLYLVPTITPSCGNYAINEVAKGIVRQNFGTQTDADGNVFATTKPRDGAFENTSSQFNGVGSGVVEGTPTALITNTNIEQITDGFSVQLNWNFEHHKFMVGASIDKSSADYSSTQRLGLLDSKRDAYLAPNEVGIEYSAASQDIRANDFDGTSITKSLYFSETWSPVENWHFTGSARYNDTKVKNNLAVRAFDFELSEFTTRLLPYVLCSGSDPATCPSGESGSYYKVDYSKFLREKESEKFSYYSLNPSLGATWQANKDLNVYANWNQGTRTPSVIELGCAYDGTLVPVPGRFNPDGTPLLKPRSIAENRFCSLPTMLSGDPYLPQVKAETFEMGARGNLTENLVWNLDAYHTTLKDDIYFVSFTGGRNFFQSIGKTARKGVEAGISGKYGKASFHINYALTEATFEDRFNMLSAHNSSAGKVGYGTVAETANFQQITVSPGSRMPGVPLQNLNATVSYELTDKWNIGLSAVVHSWAYVRGNENNEHRVGAPNIQTLYDGVGGPMQLVRQPFNNPGKTAGYAVLNLQTSYKLSPEWTLGLQVNNLLNKEYFSAGRLGVNPFSPSINGVIGPSGYNYNSNDWQNSNFLAPGAPRAAWISLSYDFMPDKKSEISNNLYDNSED